MPNPACMEFNKYEWIGKLMGACLRSEENLVINCLIVTLLPHVTASVVMLKVFMCL